MTENTSFTIKVNGKMYIGDLCYALSDDVYSNVWGGHNFEEGAYNTQDGMFAMVGTAYGDGTYSSSIGFDFPVDAGIIGICDGKLAVEDYDGSGLLVDAVGEATISYNNGTISITYTTPNGHTEFVDIETAEDDYYYEEEDEDEDEDYE